MRQSMSSGFPTKWDSNQRPVRKRIMISLMASVDMILSKKGITKALISLRVCCSQFPQTVFFALSPKYYGSILPSIQSRRSHCCIYTQWTRVKALQISLGENLFQSGGLACSFTCQLIDKQNLSKTNARMRSVDEWAYRKYSTV